MTNKPLTHTGLVFSILLGLAACGSDSSTAPATQNTSTSKGAITAFGSVYVNGVEYSTSGATVTMEGRPASESDLRVGMVVCVVKGSQGNAAAIYYDDDLEGIVTAVTPTAGTTTDGTFVVNGRTVTTNASTVFDDGIASLADIVANTTFVEVSGYDNQMGQMGGITATRVEAGSPDGSSDSSDPCDSSGHNGDEVELEGKVTAISPTSITVGDKIFLIDASTTIEGTPVVGNLVEVEGRYNSAGVLVAHEIEIEDNHPAMVPIFYGTVASVMATSPNVGSITLTNGSVVYVDANTIMQDSSGMPDTAFNLADIRVGDYLEIYAYGTGPYTAVKIEREDAPSTSPAPPAPAPAAL